jgi:hypothetical protein
VSVRIAESYSSCAAAGPANSASIEKVGQGLLYADHGSVHDMPNALR